MTGTVHRTTPGADSREPLPLEGLRERFLPECAFRGRQNSKLRYTVLAAASPSP